MAAALDMLIAKGSADLLSDDDVSFGRFDELSGLYQLGAGETECLVLAESLGCSVSCDDLRARSMIAKEIGSSRLTGTIGLLQMAVAEGLMTETEARSAHSTMIKLGAFLPALSLSVQTAGTTAR